MARIRQSAGVAVAEIPQPAIRLARGPVLETNLLGRAALQRFALEIGLIVLFFSCMEPPEEFMFS